jgi:23S rRNA (guanine1835-N2)-methyltransferase
MQTLTVPQGEFKLARYPYRAKEQLRAWDAADEYLLHHLHDEGLPAQNAAMLVLNDDSGALATALAPHHPQALSDSYLTHQATFACCTA